MQYSDSSGCAARSAVGDDDYYLFGYKFKFLARFCDIIDTIEFSL